MFILIEMNRFGRFRVDTRFVSALCLCIVLIKLFSVANEDLIVGLFFFMINEFCMAFDWGEKILYKLE